MSITAILKETPPEISEAIKEPTFSHHWRCDRCGFQAYYVARKGHSELLFCGHHGNKHIVALTIQGFTVFDFTVELEEKRTLEEEPETSERQRSIS